MKRHSEIGRQACSDLLQHASHSRVAAVVAVPTAQHCVDRDTADALLEPALDLSSMRLSAGNRAADSARLAEADVIAASSGSSSWLAPNRPEVWYCELGG